MRTDALRFLRSLDTCDWPLEQDKTVPLNSVIFWPAPRPGVFQQISMFITWWYISASHPLVTRVPESTGWNAAPDHHRASLTIHWRIAKVLLNFSFITKDHFDTVLLTWGSIFHLSNTVNLKKLYKRTVSSNSLCWWKMWRLWWGNSLIRSESESWVDHFSKIAELRVISSVLGRIV